MIHSVKISGWEYSVPGSFSDLNMEQLGHFARAVFSEFKGDDPELERACWFLYSIAGRRFYKALKKLNDVQFAQVLDLVKWVNEEIEPSPVPKEFKFLGKTYQAPQNFMESSALIEFVMAEANLLLLSEDTSKLSYITASLYRETEKKKGKDKRVKFDGDELEERAELFKKLPDVYHAGAVLFLTAVKRNLMPTYPEALKEKTGSAESRELPDWQSTMLSIAENGVFGTLEQVKFTNMHEVFLFLDKKERERPKE